MLVIFHSSDGKNHCDDGFAAAWVFWKKHRDSAVYLPGVYGSDPPIELAHERAVVLVDFSYKREQMKELIRASASTLVLDHHATAEDELSGLSLDLDGEPVAAEIKFDMSKSGAALAWDHCAPGVNRPDLIDRIEDNDLWRTPRRYADSLAVQAALRSYPQTFEVWDDLMARPIRELADEGAAIRRFIEAKVAELKRTAWRAEIGGVEMPVCNAPWFLASELAGQLAEDDANGRAAVYFEQKGRRVFSLRARGDADVSAIAKRYGGGGHKGAAGFEAPKP
ncbi:MAG: phosphohydrolase [Gammaproteobacteria bacterium]|nr:phosphohydrolase [Gammaproteobacteria bacterium]